MCGFLLLSTICTTQDKVNRIEQLWANRERNKKVGERRRQQFIMCTQCAIRSAKWTKLHLFWEKQREKLSERVCQKANTVSLTFSNVCKLHWFSDGHMIFKEKQLKLCQSIWDFSMFAPVCRVCVSVVNSSECLRVLNLKFQEKINFKLKIGIFTKKSDFFFEKNGSNTENNVIFTMILQKHSNFSRKSEFKKIEFFYKILKKTNVFI